MNCILNENHTKGDFKKLTQTSGQDGGVGNTLCLLVQPQKKLQLDLKTNNIQTREKIKLYEVQQRRI